ncbi:DUF5615 family PIN-like protein [Candidatus Berkelbacteria bacterium]|nr:DUF5615 family PIN-like protein [Candidatus Berkelbacteria bacterium]
MNARHQRQTRHHPKPKILLDESLPGRDKFPQLNSYCNCKHVNEFSLNGATDPVVYDKAITEKRILVTFNIKDFKKLVIDNSSGPSVIGLSTRLSYEQIDKKVLSKVKNLTESEFVGKYFSITN